MVEHVDAHYGYVKDIDGDGARCDQPAYDIQFKISNLAKFKVIQAFSHHSISLHIDDGCMGGGNIIPFEEFVSWVNNPNSSQGIGIHSLGWLGGRTVTTKQSIEGMYKNEYDMTPNDGKDTYFTQSRKGIFHYCVIGAYAGYERKAGSDTVPHGRGAMAGKRDLPADLDGDFFCVWGKAMTGKYDCDEWWASMWMHELGHCLGLDADAYYNSKGKEISDSIYPSRMRYGRDKGDKGFIDYSGKTGSIEVYKSDGTKYSGIKLNTDDWGVLDLEQFS